LQLIGELKKYHSLKTITGLSLNSLFSDIGVRMWMKKVLKYTLLIIVLIIVFIVSFWISSSEGFYLVFGNFPAIIGAYNYIMLTALISAFLTTIAAFLLIHFFFIYEVQEDEKNKF
jgi:predicted membrane metal-binding protein